MWGALYLRTAGHLKISLESERCGYHANKTIKYYNEIRTIVTPPGSPAAQKINSALFSAGGLDS